MIQVEIFTRDFGRRLLAFWPDCGKCFAPFYRKINFQKNAPHGTQLPNLAPRLRRRQERFGAENKTPECCQYWLPGFGSTAPEETEKVSELND